jgi:hypothetical protein
MPLIALYNNERFIVDHADPSWTYYYPIRWLLVPHGIAGAIALFFGDHSNFSRRPRNRRGSNSAGAGRGYEPEYSLAQPDLGMGRAHDHH